MKIAPFPSEEALRIKDLLSYGILDSEDEKEYDDLVQLASQICDCPIALINFIDNNRQWFKARKSVGVTETTRNIAFCSHTILQDEVMVVKDARSDDRFHDNPLVIGEVQIGFYAGAPIFSSSGFKLGTVCVIDHIKKDDLSDKQKQSLKIIAGQVSKLLELRATNKLIIKHSEAQIKAEKKISQLLISENDTKDNSIAYELHENLAQTLTAIKLFIETAENSKELKSHFLQKSKEAILLLIDEVKNLSKSIIPTTIKNADYYWVIQEYTMKFGQLNDIEVRFGKVSTIKSKTSNIGLNLFKIVQKQLEIAKISEANEIFLDLQTDSQVTLEFRYDINKTEITEITEVISPLINNITTRVEIMEGVINQKTNLNENTFLINLPVSSIL